MKSTEHDFMEGYRLVHKFYGDRKAERSGVPLMNHINEGLIVLDELGATWQAKEAFCLHPLLQSNNDLAVNYCAVSKTVAGLVLLYAMEYRNIANQYLSHRQIWSPEEIALSPIHEVNIMLIADKIQNYKDFLIYHKETHPRSDALNQYFQNWLKRLNVGNFQYWLDLLSVKIDA